MNKVLLTLTALAGLTMSNVSYADTQIVSDSNAANATHIPTPTVEDLTGKTLYGPVVDTWNDKFDHSKGIHKAQHLTEAGQAIKQHLKEQGYSESQIRTILREWYDHGNVIPTQKIQDSEETDDAMTPEGNKPPDFNHLWSDGPVSRAIKEKLNDPDSYKFENTTDPVKDKHDGLDSWVVVVHFRAKNAFNALTRNYAYVWVVDNGEGAWKAIDCQINP